MAGSVNKVILVGNLGRDPEVRSTGSGQRVANLNVATSESWRDKMSGERRERTEWHRVVIFNNRLVEIAEKFLQKGSKVYLEGQLQTRKWTDQSGVEKYTTEVVLQNFGGELTMLDSPPPANVGARDVYSAAEERGQNSGFGDGGYGGNSAGPGAGGSGGATQSGELADDLDDEIPF